MGPTRVLLYDPHPLGIPEILAVANMSPAFWDCRVSFNTAKREILYGSYRASAYKAVGL